MNLISEEPILSNFFKDMNKHPFTAYAMKGDYVIEVELFQKNERYEQSSNRVSIRIWKAQTHKGMYVPAKEKSRAKYHWYHAAASVQGIDKYLSEDGSTYQHAEEVAANLKNDRAKFEHFIEQYNNTEHVTVDKRNPDGIFD